MMDNKAQIHTLEGFAAAALITLTILYITQSVVIITPQTELSTDVQLKQIVSDALTGLDVSPATAIQYNLAECVANWNMSEATPLGGNLKVLSDELSGLLTGILYNVDFAYVENGSLTVKHVIIHGAPTDNSVVARRLVTLKNSTVADAGGTWNIPQDELLLVEVRLTAWQV